MQLGDVITSDLDQAGRSGVHGDKLCCGPGGRFKSVDQFGNLCQSRPNLGDECRCRTRLLSMAVTPFGKPPKVQENIRHDLVLSPEPVCHRPFDARCQFGMPAPRCNGPVDLGPPRLVDRPRADLATAGRQGGLENRPADPHDHECRYRGGPQAERKRDESASRTGEPDRTRVQERVVSQWLRRDKCHAGQYVARTRTNRCPSDVRTRGPGSRARHSAVGTRALTCRNSTSPIAEYCRRSAPVHRRSGSSERGGHLARRRGEAPATGTSGPYGRCHDGLVRRTFANRPAQLPLAAFGALIVLIGLASVSAGEVFGWAYLILGAVFVVRSLRSSSVVLGADLVETRSLVRTRRHPLCDLTGVEVAVGRTGMNSGDREYLIFQRRDGSRFSFKELNAKPGDGSIVQSAQAAILERLRHPGG